LGAILGKDQGWARGYFCATVGTVTEAQVKAYIEGHDEEPPEENFKISEPG
jgi:putative transposase